MLPIAALSALLAVALSSEPVIAHDLHLHHKRQSPTTTSSSTTANPSSGNPSSGTTSYGIPALVSITSGMTGPTPTLSTTYPAGAVPTFKNAPPLPPAFVFNPAEWPAQDVIPPTDSPEVKEWMKVLEGKDILDIPVTNGSECALSPEAAAHAEERRWWTCGGWTGANDITSCPDHNTWGLSFDDGPSDYSELLLQYLKDHNKRATFFVVGSRVIARPDILRAEIMDGHEVCCHTWSHHPLTNMTNAQIVAELGWSKKAIKAVTGVTPICLRPPYGDIDDRVRGIVEAMGLNSIMWTRTDKATFDTNDWRVADGSMTGPQQIESFKGLLGNASTLDTGFIVLEHDLFIETVDLAVGYTLDIAQSQSSSLTLESIGQCQHWADNDIYVESATSDILGSGSGNDTDPDSSTGDQKGASSSGSGDGNGAVGVQLPSSAALGVFGAVAAFFIGSL